MKNLFEIELKKSAKNNISDNKKSKSFINKPSHNDLKSGSKKVLVATPSLDGKVDVWFADSLAKTISLCKTYNIDIHPIFICNESLLHMARNEYIKFAYEGEYDSLIFIDSDQRWDHEYFLKVVQSEKDALSLPVCLKNDIPKFNFKSFKSYSEVKTDNETGEFTIEKIGTGFFKLSKKLIKDLWDSNETVLFKGVNVKMIFDFSYDGEEYVGEDYTICQKIRELGYDVWVNPNTTCQHVGPKKYDHDFLNFMNKKNNSLKNEIK